LKSEQAASKNPTHATIRADEDDVPA